MTLAKFTVNTVDSAAFLTDQLYPQTGGGTNDSLSRIARYFDGLADGAFYFNTVAEEIGLVNATATFTITSTGPTNGETGSVANSTLTAVTSGAVPASGQFNISATPSVVATGMALAINSVPALVGIVTATSNSGVVTVTAVTSGVLGNGLQISAGNLANTVAAAFSGGSNGTKTVLA